jgi:phenylalanyl-tRNA synthetase alpha chain
MMTLDDILPEAQREFAACNNIQDLEQAKARFLGKSGSLTEQLKGLGKLSAEERPAAGAAINVVKQGVEEALKARRDAILNAGETIGE